jgi:hypothetical protein
MLYSDESGASNCKVCGPEQKSVGHGCVPESADKAMPKPTRVMIRMLGSAEENLRALNDAARDRLVESQTLASNMRIKWNVIDVHTHQPRKEKSFTHFDIHLSSPIIGNTTQTRISALDALIAEQTSNLDYASYAAIVFAGAPLYASTVFVKIRTFDENEDSWSEWSDPHKSWLSTGANSCSDAREYLNSTDPDPLLWKCLACPEGAYCEHSVTWRHVKANASFWRDDHERNVTSPAFVPPTYKFIPCPNKAACMGSNSTETCDESAGYLNICNKDRNTTCRLCNTCFPGFSMGADGITCFPCARKEDQAQSLALAVLVLLLLFSVLGTLVFLKIKSATRGHGAKTKAVHSTVKRILLSHLQVIAMCMSLNVPWPRLITDMMMAFSSMSSVSQHVSAIGCFYDTDESGYAGKNARFLYLSAGAVLLSPVAFAIITWVYWMYLVPSMAGRVLACGLQSSLTFSDPTPNMCRQCRRRPAPTDSDTESLSNGPSNDGRNASTMPVPRLSNASTTSMASVVVQAIERNDLMVKTRDVWSYTNVLFLYMMYPSLCRIPFTVLSCRRIHRGTAPEDRGEWSTVQYLRIDMEETCWDGQHAIMVGALAIPGTLVYALGLPLTAFVILFRHRTKLYTTKKYLFRLGLLYSGFRPNRWWYEGVVTARKFFIIVAAAFLYDDALQLHFTLSVLMAAYAIHHILMPFVPTAAGSVDSDVGNQAEYSKAQTTLHVLERSSIFISLAVVWSASVFILYEDTLAMHCENSACQMLVLLVLFMNVGFLVAGIWLFAKHFMKRNERVLRALLTRARSRLGSMGALPTSSGGREEGSAPAEADVPTASFMKVFVNPQHRAGSGGRGGESKAVAKATETTRPKHHMTVEMAKQGFKHGNGRASPHENGRASLRPHKAKRRSYVQRQNAMKKLNERRQQQKLRQKLSKDGANQKPDPNPNPLFDPETQVVEMVLTAKPRLALFDYAADDADEIDLAAGDVLEGVTDIGGGWATGTNKSTNRRGTFPVSFVEVAAAQVEDKYNV